MKNFTYVVHLDIDSAKNEKYFNVIGFNYNLRNFLKFISNPWVIPYFTGKLCEDHWCDHHDYVHVCFNLSLMLFFLFVSHSKICNNTG